ncbi:MAG: DUF3857 domain-containing protein [Acidobacteria bacterium]|nr:DUF3857 domain-containing protein [Acidobacteriota bacterium]
MKFLLFIVIAGYLAGSDWRPISNEKLKLKTAKVDPNANAETIFWEAWVRDESAGNGYLNHVVENYIRIKLYNDRAVEKYGNVEIPFNSAQKMSVYQIRARTIKPDGSIVELPGSAVKEQMVQKVGKQSFRAKTFAMPGLEPGAILEYQWVETYSEFVPRYVTLMVQREIPAWEVTYNVKPFTGFGFNERMGSYPFRCKPTPWEPVTADARHLGFVKTHIQNVPAYVEEPMMPAEDDTKAWILLFYSPSSKDKPEAFWKSLGKQLNGEFQRMVKVNNDIKRVAQEVAGGATDVFEKARLLSDYCTTKIRNMNYNMDGGSQEERAEFFKGLKDGHNSTNTLRLQKGTSEHILALFYALGEAAGLDVVYARAGTANGAMFRMDLLDRYLLPNRLVAVRQGEKIQYYNPGIPYLPAGTIDWDEQAQAALLADPKEPKLVMTPVATPEAHRLKRVADLTMTEEGKVSGKVSMAYSGHLGVKQKRLLEGKSEAEREEILRKRLEGRYAGAKITNLKIENAGKPVGDVVVQFDIEMDNYAQRTGKRLFFQPAFFQYGDQPLFTAAERKMPVMFREAYTEQDTIRFRYPEGYALDHAEIPGTVNLGGVGTFKMSGSVSNREPLLTMNRELVWGEKGTLFFDPKLY